MASALLPAPLPSPVQVIDHMLDLLATPSSWCKGDLERTAILGAGGEVVMLWKPDDGLLPPPDLFAGAVGGQVLVQRCFVGAERRALLDAGHLRTADRLVGGTAIFIDRVARQVTQHLAAAVGVRFTPPFGAPTAGCDCSVCSPLPGEAALVPFNDAPATTHAQVLEALKDARLRAVDVELRGAR